jgi:hypothetical protein
VTWINKKLFLFGNVFGYKRPQNGYQRHWPRKSANFPKSLPVKMQRSRFKAGMKAAENLFRVPKDSVKI